MAGNSSGFDLGWHETKHSQQRLDEISHLFLSDTCNDRPLPAVPGDHATCFLPLMLETASQRWVARVLADGLAGSGHPASVVEIGESLSREEPCPDSGTRWDDADLRIPLTRKCDRLDGRGTLSRLREVLHDRSIRPEFCLLVQQQFNLSLAAHIGRVLVPVVASLSGIRCAYAGIKQILTHAPDVQISLLLIDARDEAGGYGYIEKLTAGVRHFLRRTPEYGGCLPWERKHFADESVNGDGEYLMKGVIGRLIACSLVPMAV